MLQCRNLYNVYPVKWIREINVLIKKSQAWATRHAPCVSSLNQLTVREPGWSVAIGVSVHSFFFFFLFYHKIIESYGGILLPPTCKINYVNMQHNYVNMRLIYVDMQHNYVDMHVINFCQKLFFSMGKISY